jgi:alpha-mannosidase
MRLSLLRSPTAPDPEADYGEHHFSYALLPFTGSFAASRTVRSAYELNAAATIEAASNTAAGTGNSAGVYSFCSVDSEAVIVECLKAPELQDGIAPEGVVLRLYESLGSRARTTLRFVRPLARAEETDMLEGNGKAIPFSGQELSLEFSPFEIKTLRVCLG